MSEHNLSSTEIDANRRQRSDDIHGHRAVVRLLVDTCHGLAGQVVAISSSRARDLINQGRAEAADGEPLSSSAQ